ncbi:hypothetical protein RJ640_022558 [Escallonia rubra]|uniref:Large ribosomal subunit protein mL53 n=1 Tax=Escallonia rubra TaxID=112253 RepID=A0AA88RPE0_9ASTE|nr:hypothetical protein RJ640_022558 [Escallonia rubra]
MLKFLSRVRIEFNALDPRTAASMEFLAQCNARKAKESNPACQVVVKRCTDDHPPQITVTFVNGVEEMFDATATPAQDIRNMILEKGQMLETEQMFKEAGEKWPVVIPEEELSQSFPGTKGSEWKEKAENLELELQQCYKAQARLSEQLVVEVAESRASKALAVEKEAGLTKTQNELTQARDECSRLAAFLEENTKGLDLLIRENKDLKAQLEEMKHRANSAEAENRMLVDRWMLQKMQDAERLNEVV